MGTAPYMSPEQARGHGHRQTLGHLGVRLRNVRDADRRHAPSPAKTSQTRSSRWSATEPDWTALPAMTPASIRRLLRRCLDERSQTALRLGSGRSSRHRRSVEYPIVCRWNHHGRSCAALGGRTGLALGGGRPVRHGAPRRPSVGVARGRRPRPGRRSCASTLATPPTNNPLAFALSPDGQHVAFVAAAADGPSQLWVRSLAADTAQPLPGTTQASSPFWSPDSQSIGFFADGRLKRLDLEGGAAQTLAPALNSIGGAAWSRTGVIVFAWVPGVNLSRVSESGGDVTPVTSLDPKQHVSHRYPSFLSDGERFLFFAQGTRSDSTGIYLGALDGSAPRRLIATDSAARAFGTDRLVFVHQGTLWVQRFDANRGTVVGDPVAVADGVVAGDGARRAAGRIRLRHGHSRLPPGRGDGAFRADVVRWCGQAPRDPSGTRSGRSISTAPVEGRPAGRARPRHEWQL